MSLTIATNVSSLNTQKWLNVSSSGQAGALEQLSSGTKINKAADDAAGMAISTKLNVKASSLNKAIDNGNQSIAMLQTAESGIQTIADILTRLKALATESASDNNATDRASLDSERSELEAQITNIAGNTLYGTTSLLGGANSYALGAALTPANGLSSVNVSGAAADTYTLATTGTALTLTNVAGDTQTINIGVKPTATNTTTVNFNKLGVSLNVNSSLADGLDGTITVTKGTSGFTFQLGAENAANNRVSVSIGDFTASAAAGLNISGDLTTQAHAQTYMDTIDNAVAWLNTQEAAIGASQNKINYQISNLTSTLQNTQSAVSTIKDTDYAASMSEFTKYQVMTQAGVAMLTQSNQLPQQILSLLKG